MPIPDFVLALREKIGTMPLWLSGVTAVVIHDTRVLLVKRVDNGQWTPIAGIIEPGEEPAVAARREALEEASVVIEPERLVWVHALEPIAYENGDQARYLDLVFRCRYVSGEAAVGDDENTDVGWFERDDLPRLSDNHRRRIELAFRNAETTAFERE